MKKKLKILLAQLNPIGGDVKGNFKKLEDAWKRACESKIDIIALPEMFLSGYPIDDLVLRGDFISSIEKHISKLAKLTLNGPAIIVGCPRNDNGIIRNSVFILDNGEILGFRDKAKLPNEHEFYDNRQFVPGDLPGPILIRGIRFGVPICEDIWDPEVCECLKESGAEIILSINGSTYNIDKMEKRVNNVVSRAVENDIPLIYLNLVGGQDELIFDGGSFAVNSDGQLACQLPMFETFDGVIEIENNSSSLKISSKHIFKDQTGYESLYSAIMLSLRDYVTKNSFKNVILGLSGGIDSALVSAVAVDALGPENVRCFMLPSKFTSQDSTNDAKDISDRLDIKLEALSIEELYNSVENTLKKTFNSLEKDITEENIQSRLRGLMLMAISNKHGAMVLATGNKSEYAAGYSTLYGDMCGGFAPIKDVWKVQVFDLCRWRNANMPRGGAGPEGEVIPVRIIDKPPSAELRPDQKDTDSLPPYDRLDAIMKALCEEMVDIETIAARGYDRDEVARASQLLFRAEYKRFQAAPGPKMNALAFGRERRLPLTSGFNPLTASGKES